MRLKTKLIAAFLFVAWVPLLGAVWLLTQGADERFEVAFEQRVSDVESIVEERLKRVARELDRGLSAVAEDPLFDRILVTPLVRGRFYNNTEQRYERAVTKETVRLVGTSTFDTLRIVDLKRGTAPSSNAGYVVAVGHRAGGVEQDDLLVVETLADGGNWTFFRQERINAPDGGTREVWTLQTLKVLAGRVAFVAGRIVNDAFIEDMRRGAGNGAQAALEDGAGARILATYDGPEPPGDAAGYRVAKTVLRGNNNKGEPVANLTVHVSRGQMTAARKQLWSTAGILAGVGALIALLVGLWISRRLSRPLERLADAASAVAAGDRDRQVLELRGRDEVASLTRAFNQMTIDLSSSEERLRQSERVAAWREIARRIAHEIKNPLFPIQMSIETLKKVWDRKHPDFEEIFEESTSTILEEVERMKRIVTEFSDFARMPAPRRARCDVSETVRSVLSLHKDAAHGATLRQLGAESLVVEADSDQLRQALVNLVQNGVDAIAEAGRGDDGVLEVRVETDDASYCRIVVTDNGPGMDDETQAKLFVPYFTTKSAGTGLGLAIVHRIVEEHGGSIRVDSKQGAGTRFVVRLPLTA